MKKLMFLFLLVFTVNVLNGCRGSMQLKGPIPNPGETCIWKSEEPSPRWPWNEPEKEGEYLFFVGLSYNYATEKDSRDDAMKTAIKNVVSYMGTYVKTKYENLRVSHGLTTEIIDPAKDARELEEQQSAAIAEKVKASKWYLEKWFVDKTKETYFKAYLLTQVPESSLSQVYENAIDGKIDELKQKRDAANDAKAKAQFQSAMDAFDKAKQAGFKFE